jgi:hypothetical protein
MMALRNVAMLRAGRLVMRRVVELFDEGGDAGVLVLFGEGGRLVEEEPCEGGGGVKGDEDVENAEGVSAMVCMG